MINCNNYGRLPFANFGTILSGHFTYRIKNKCVSAFWWTNYVTDTISKLPPVPTVYWHFSTSTYSNDNNHLQKANTGQYTVSASIIHTVYAVLKCA